jgi:hypothetical protein
MRQPESSTDQTAAWKDTLDLLGRGISGDIEVLGMLAEQQIAHAPADNKCLVAGVLKLAHHFGRPGAQLVHGNLVLRCRNGNQFSDGSIP